VARERRVSRFVVARLAYSKTLLPGRGSFRLGKVFRILIADTSDALARFDAGCRRRQYTQHVEPCGIGRDLKIEVYEAVHQNPRDAYETGECNRAIDLAGPIFQFGLHLLVSGVTVENGALC